MCACCVPSRGGGGGARPASRTEPGRPGREGMAEIPGGVFRMGSEDPMAQPGDGESPVREVALSPYLIDACAVTNDEFAAFVAETGHRTEAEHEGWSFVFAGLLPEDFPPTRAAEDAPWWRAVEGACWHRPEGTGSDLSERGRHPVVHVAWQDAAEYAVWAGKLLPTEAQWERAARGGRDARWHWGDELEPGGRHMMNAWQGEFPIRNTLADGWLGTCPVDAFPPNSFGLRNMTGNVWEWCADWFGPPERAPGRDPAGPAWGDAKVAKGGSFLCHASYCARYRPAGRMAMPPESTASNLGFRCAAPL